MYAGQTKLLEICKESLQNGQVHEALGVINALLTGDRCTKYFEHPNNIASAEAFIKSKDDEHGGESWSDSPKELALALVEYAHQQSVIDKIKGVCEGDTHSSINSVYF